jgi:hypothetical protein
MTPNSNEEIANLKNRIFGKTKFSLSLKNINIVFKKTKNQTFEKFFQKKVYNLIETCLENSSFLFFTEIIVFYVYFPKINHQSINLFLNYVIEFFIKNISYNFFKNNYKLIHRITRGKNNNYKISLKINSIIDIVCDSKGKVITNYNHKYFKNTEVFSEISYYEYSQKILEILRINFDSKQFSKGTTIINHFLEKFPIDSNFSNIKINFYEQIFLFLLFIKL